MERFCGVHKEGRRPRTRERRRNLAPDVTGFAHPRDNNACLAVQNSPYRRLKIIIDALRKLRD